MPRRWICALTGLALALTVSGCGKTTAGHPQSGFIDPVRVAGMPAVDGPSGLKPGVEVPKRKVLNTDNGKIDKFVVTALTDIEDYWTKYYNDSFAVFRPAPVLISVDGRSKVSKIDFCGEGTAQWVNAAFCPVDYSIAWDRGIFMPVLRQQFGDMAMSAVMAHEYGHSVQTQANLVAPIDDPTMSGRAKMAMRGLVKEQQADCLSGAYMRWVAEGDSPRFTVSTGSGLNSVLAAVLSVRDSDTSRPNAIHGSAFERASAFQFGFTDGPTACKEIDGKEILKRRGDLPKGLGEGPLGDDWPVDRTHTDAVLAAAAQVFPMADPPKTVYGNGKCPDASGSAPASYCPASNTIALDTGVLQELATPVEDGSVLSALINGDFSAFSIVVSRYALAAQKAAGLEIAGMPAALRTACLTGYFTARAAGGGIATPRSPVILSGGDLDEAVSGLLQNGRVSSDVTGNTVPAGFSRIEAYRTGVLGNDQTCANRFP